MSEDDYQFVRGLELRNAVVPVVGNLAGPSALAAIGRAVRQRGETVSVFYVSNVELYLFQDGVFQRYADTVSGLPHSTNSVLIRSIFSGPGVWSLPDTRPATPPRPSSSVWTTSSPTTAPAEHVTYDGLVSLHFANRDGLRH